MHLIMISLLCTVSNGISRISVPNFKAINFAEKINAQKLNGSLIRDIKRYSSGFGKFLSV